MLARCPPGTPQKSILSNAINKYREFIIAVTPNVRLAKGGGCFARVMRGLGFHAVCEDVADYASVALCAEQNNLTIRLVCGANDLIIGSGELHVELFCELSFTGNEACPQWTWSHVQSGYIVNPLTGGANGVGSPMRQTVVALSSSGVVMQAETPVDLPMHRLRYCLPNALQSLGVHVNDQVYRFSDLVNLSQSTGYHFVLVNNTCVIDVPCQAANGWTDNIVVLCDDEFTHAFACVASGDDVVALMLESPRGDEDSVALATDPKAPKDPLKAAENKKKRDAQKERRRKAKEENKPLPMPAGVKSADYLTSLGKLELDEPARLTLSNIQRRMTALERRNFSAANFGAHDFSSLMRLCGRDVPASSLESAIQTIESVANGEMLHPKRFDEMRSSLVIKTTASKIVSLSSISAGDVIYVVTPCLHAYKGSIVIKRNPASTSFAVVAYVAPDRDPEDISTQCAVLFSKMSVAAPLVAGGTVTIISQAMLEQGVSTVNPVAIIAGKAAAVARGRHAPIHVIGSELNSTVHFTATEAPQVVKRFSASDPFNTSLVDSPNAALLPGGTAARPSPSQSYMLRCAGFDATTSTSAGFNVNLGSNNNSVVWRLSNCQDYLRHLLYGDFVFGFNFTVAPSVANTLFSQTLVVTFSDGTTLQENFATNMTSQAAASLSGNLSTLGNTLWAAKRGLIIIDMVLTCTVAAGSNYLSSASNTPGVHVNFIDVPAATDYHFAIISNMPTTGSLAINLEVHTEVTLDQAAENSTYLSATPDLPYDPLYLPTVLRAHCALQERYEAGSFLNGLKSIGKFLWNNGGKEVATGLLKKGASMITSKLGATSFGKGAIADVRTGFSFPAVREGEGEIVAVIKGAANDHTPDFCPFDLRPSIDNYDGASSYLAFALATAAALGCSVRPGIYSGEVDEFNVTSTTVEFNVYPVDDQAEKMSHPEVRGLFPDGWWNGSSFRVLKARDLAHFGCLIKPVENKPGYPGSAFSVAIPRVK